MNYNTFEHCKDESGFSYMLINRDLALQGFLFLPIFLLTMKIIIY